MGRLQGKHALVLGAAMMGLLADFTREIMAQVDEIKRWGKGRDHDCLIGISGGVDSSSGFDGSVERGMAIGACCAPDQASSSDASSMGSSRR
mgnify:CR=1 FL=1